MRWCRKPHTGKLFRNTGKQVARPRTLEHDGLRTVERAAEVLRQFSCDGPALGLQELARSLGLPRSTAHRLLRSMEAAGFLVYDPESRTYRLGLWLARLGEVAMASVELRTAARPYLQSLAAETGESALLLVVRGSSAVVIDVQESQSPLRLTLPVGTPWPLHAGASNRVILAFLPAHEREEILRQPLDRITQRTITDPDRLRRELHWVRHRGFAYSVGELTPGVAAVAVPILADGRLLGGLAVAGPAARLTRGRVPGVVRRLQEAAAAIARNLYGSPIKPS